MVDAQSVKTCGNVAEASQGIDAGKKIKGRKRHLVTDTLGLVLAVLVTAASVHDSAGVIQHGAGLGIDVEVVRRPKEKGFQPLPKRWVIEWTFGWLMQHRRLARDYEALPQRSRTMIHWAMVNRMSRELTGESAPT